METNFDYTSQKSPGSNVIPTMPPVRTRLARTVVSVGLAASVVLGGVGCTVAKPSRDELKASLLRSLPSEVGGIAGLLVPPFIDCLVVETYDKTSADTLWKVARVQSPDDMKAAFTAVPAADKATFEAAGKVCGAKVLGV